VRSSLPYRFETVVLALISGAVAAVASAQPNPATGVVLDGETPLDPRSFARPVAIAASTLGRLYVADLGRGVVVQIDSIGQVAFEFESPPRVPSLQPLDIEVTGFQVYVLDAQSNAVLRYSEHGAFLDVLQSFADSGVETPRALAVDRTGRMLLAQTARHQVRLVDANQRIETTIGGFGTRAGEFVHPAGVAFASDGSFFISDPGARRVQRFTPVGNFASACTDSLEEPRALAVLSSGELVVTDSRRRAVLLLGAGGLPRDELRLGDREPLDLTVVGDSGWVLVSKPEAVIRLRIVRDGAKKE